MQDALRDVLREARFGGRLQGHIDHLGIGMTLTWASPSGRVFGTTLATEEIEYLSRDSLGQRIATWVHECGAVIAAEEAEAAAEARDVENRQRRRTMNMWG